MNADGTVTYVPRADRNGADTFRYTLTDADGQTSTGVVTVTITPVDDVPSAVGDFDTLAEDRSTITDVLANDTGLGDAPVAVTIVTPPLHGTATPLPDGTVRYEPRASYAGGDTYTYRVSDADGQASTAAVALTITAVNDAPALASDVAATDLGTAVDIPVLANDVDVDGDVLSVVSITTPSNGTATINTNGTVR